MDWKVISMGGGHICALKNEGSLWCWGSNLYGQTGDGTTISSSAPVKIDVTMDWQVIATGESHTCALKNEGSLWCWGDNQFGQLGDETIVNQSKPVKIGIAMDWRVIVAGNGFTCALKREGSLWCWGSKPMQIDAALDWQGIATGGSNICSLKRDGSLWCWGTNDYGQLGNGGTLSQSKPVQIDASRDWQAITSRAYHTCALKKEGSLWCWGRNNVGQLGDGTIVDDSMLWQMRTTPVQIGSALDWQTITAGDFHTCALKNNSSLWCWGYNLQGQLGDGSTVNQSKPVQIGTAFDWQTIAAGDLLTCALKKDGSLWCWGTDRSPDQIISQPSTPVQIGMDMDWRAIAVSSYRICALKKEGSLWCLRNIGSALLADGTREAVQYQPEQIGISMDWQTIAMSPYHTCVIKVEGSLWCWGKNDYGQLGNGTTFGSFYDLSTPEGMVQVDMDRDWQAIAVGPSHTCALKKEGSLWCWGRNTSGELGDGTTVTKGEPSPVSNFPSGSQIAMEQTRTCSIDINGFLWCWGMNFELLQSEFSTWRITPQRVKLP